jgi:hypothetical protein
MRNILKSLMGAGVMLLFASCELGPTAMLADGSRVTLGGDLLAEGSGDARSANMPNGLKMKWVRSSYNETSVAKTAIGTWGGVELGRSTEHSTNVANIEKTKQTKITTQGATDQAVIGKTASPTSNVTTPSGLTITQPAVPTTTP